MTTIVDEDLVPWLLVRLQDANEWDWQVAADRRAALDGTPGGVA